MSPDLKFLIRKTGRIRSASQDCCGFKVRWPYHFADIDQLQYSWGTAMYTEYHGHKHQFHH